MRPGEILPLDRDIVLNEGKETRELMVANMGDRPVQVGSHFHFLRSIAVWNLIEKKHLDSGWIFHPELLCVLSRERKDLSDSSHLEERKLSTDATI